MSKKKPFKENDTYYQAVNQMNRNDVLKEYRKVAKRLNQRLVELAKQDMKMPSGEAKTFLEKQGKTRFQERLTKYEKGKTLNQLKQELLIMHRFEESKLSTVGGQKESKRKMQETLMLKTFTPAERESYANASKKEQKKIFHERQLKNDLVDLVLTHINDLKDKMAWEYEKAVEFLFSAVSEDETLSESKLKVMIETAVNTRNEEHYKKMLNNPSLANWSTFAKSARKQFGEHVFTYSGKDYVKRRSNKK